MSRDTCKYCLGSGTLSHATGDERSPLPTESPCRECYGTGLARGAPPSVPKIDHAAVMDKAVEAMGRKLVNPIFIEGVTFADDSDDGLFRSLELTTEGSTVEEMEKNAHVFEIDQDGGEVKDYPLSRRGGEDYALALGVIQREFNKALKAEEDGPECERCGGKCSCLPRAEND